MAYSDFTLQDVRLKLGLRIQIDEGHFRSIKPVSVSHWLTETLERNSALAVAIGNEKAKSELLVAPVLVEAREQLNRAVSLFSGVDFNIDPDAGLKGNLDFLLSLSPEQYAIDSPVVAIVEAKRDDFSAGLGECIAEMFAARMFNERNSRLLATVYGVVTTGVGWMFCRLVGDQVFHDTDEYNLQNVERIMGVLVSMLRPQG